MREVKHGSIFLAQPVHLVVLLSSSSLERIPRYVVCGRQLWSPVHILGTQYLPFAFTCVIIPILAWDCDPSARDPFHLGECEMNDPMSLVQHVKRTESGLT